MVFILKSDASEEAIKQFSTRFEEQGFSTFRSKGTEHTAICLLGNTAILDMEHIVETTDIVEYGKRITEQYKAVNRTVHPEDTIIDLKGTHIGPDTFTVISGPCSIESEEQMIEIAKSVKISGAKILRGGAFKPRSSPYSFQGLGTEGLKLLIQAKKETGLPIVSEIMNQTQIPYFDEVDIIQIGARNMQNFDLLKEVGMMDKVILLKRGLSSSIEELLMSAEYIMSSGNHRVILCERGIRTFETSTRNTLDISAVVALKQKSHLPVIVDPSHASGLRSFVPPLTKAALAVGADGVMIETHNEPSKALCDGAQSLDLQEFEKLMQQIKQRVIFENRTI
jgi:3-deoxy-7-phosphoheptulonate synthase